MSLKQLEKAIIKKQFDVYKGTHTVAIVKLHHVLNLIDAFKKRCVCIPKKQLEELVETMPKPLDKKYEYRDVNGLKQIRLYDFLPNLRTWKKKLEELLEK